MNRIDDKHRISLWLNPDEEIDSAYGRVTFRAWCDKERERLSRRGDLAKVRHNEQGLIAIFRGDSSRRGKATGG